MNLNYLSVCSGVEAAYLAWRDLGWKPIAFAEVLPYQSAVLMSRFPDVNNLGDLERITTIGEEITNGVSTVPVPAGGVDVLVGGTPCQSFSSANRSGNGLAGKSGLALAYIRLLRGLQPRWFVWENVAGAIASISGGCYDFNFLVKAFAECGYDIEWRMLDSSVVFTPNFPRGLPCRRPRVFVVGRRRGLCRFPVLVNPEECCDHHAAMLEVYERKVVQDYQYLDKTLCTTTGGDVLGTLTVSGLQGKGDFIGLKSGMLVFDNRSHFSRFPLRRLTAIECERVMGFPDNWTVPIFTDPTVDVAVDQMRRVFAGWSAICGGRGKTPSGDAVKRRLLLWSEPSTAPLMSRYQCCANSMAVNCMEWIGRRIEWAEARAERMRKDWR